MARHGVFPHELVVAQEFSVDVELGLDLSHPAKTDQLCDTVDYGQVADLVQSIMDGPSYHLLEALAREISWRVLELDARIGVAVVRVRKMAPPLSVLVQGVEVEVRSER